MCCPISVYTVIFSTDKVKHEVGDNEDEFVKIRILHNMYTEEKETNNLCRPASFQILGMGTI